MKTLKYIGLVMVFAAGLAQAATTEELINDRAAIERVYHAHRTGSTEPFEQALPAPELRRLVERDSAREAALRTRYGKEITAAQVAAEVARIDRTTRAPETLAEIKAALGNDAGRFAEAFAKPIVVERELRACFDNDEAIHAVPRHESETLRARLLNAKLAGASAAELAAQLEQNHTNSYSQRTWSLGNKVETKTATERKEPRFADLPAQLQEVLTAQLRAPGDISAVIETPENFLLFVVTEMSETRLGAGCLALPKQSCDAWLTGQMTAQKK